MPEIKTDVTDTFAKITILLAPHLNMTIGKMGSRFQNPMPEIRGLLEKLEEDAYHNGLEAGKLLQVIEGKDYTGNT
jgi:hypothetical protein